MVLIDNFSDIKFNPSISIDSIVSNFKGFGYLENERHNPYNPKEKYSVFYIIEYELSKTSPPKRLNPKYFDRNGQANENLQNIFNVIKKWYISQGGKETDIIFVHGSNANSTWRDEETIKKLKEIMGKIDVNGFEIMSKDERNFLKRFDKQGLTMIEFTRGNFRGFLLFEEYEKCLNKDDQYNAEIIRERIESDILKESDLDIAVIPFVYKSFHPRSLALYPDFPFNKRYIKNGEKGELIDFWVSFENQGKLIYDLKESKWYKIKEKEKPIKREIGSR